jgi:hypothetical protein
MQQKPTLFMVLLGCTPRTRHTEQHDIFFGIGETLKDLKEDILKFWPEAEGNIHVDAWRPVTSVGDYEIEVVPKSENKETANGPESKLFFLNLGGYKEKEFEEFHYKMMVVSPNKGVAIQEARKTAFYQHTGFKGAESHVDDKYGVDVDNIHNIEDILPDDLKAKFEIRLHLGNSTVEDPVCLGYFKLDRI